MFQLYQLNSIYQLTTHTNETSLLKATNDMKLQDKQGIRQSRYARKANRDK